MKFIVKYEKILFVFILLAYLVYAGVYIEKTSFKADGVKYYALFDDAMISMRYARNLAEGYGLVWNPMGERVEGYTNLLWVLFMAIFHLLPIPITKISVFIQISGAVFLLLNLFFIRKIAQILSDNPIIWLFSVFLTAFYYSLNNWGLQGMEVSLLTALISASIWQTLISMRSQHFSYLPYILLGIATIVRMDASVIFVAILAFNVWIDKTNRTRHFLWGFVFLVIPTLFLTSFRLMYYGDLLPNTYYLKMDGIPLWFRVGHGIYVFFQSIWMSNWVFFLIALSILVTQRDKYTLLLLSVILLQSLYSIYVGGDAWEHKGGTNRFVSTVMPLFFVLFSCALDNIRKMLFPQPSLTTSKQPVQILSQIGMAIFVIISLFNFNTVFEKDGVKKWTLGKQPIFAAGTEHAAKIGLTIPKFTNENVKVAVITAGNIPYFSNRYSIDLLGKSDKWVAHTKMHTPLTADEFMVDYRPGHTKWDYAYSIGKLQPDIVAQTLTEFNDEEAAPYIEGKYSMVMIDGNPYLLLNNSPNIKWEIVNELKDRIGETPTKLPVDETLEMQD